MPVESLLTDMQTAIEVQRDAQLIETQPWFLFQPLPLDDQKTEICSI
jgi:hypothetical protein